MHFIRLLPPRKNNKGKGIQALGIQSLQGSKRTVEVNATQTEINGANIHIQKGIKQLKANQCIAAPIHHPMINPSAEFRTRQWS